MGSPSAESTSVVDFLTTLISIGQEDLLRQYRQLYMSRYNQINESILSIDGTEMRPPVCSKN